MLTLLEIQAIQNKRLNEYGLHLLEKLKKTIDDKNLKISGNLKNSIGFDISKNGNNVLFSLQFEDYGKYIEIRFHNNKNRKQSINSDVWGLKKNRHKPKNTDWWSKNTYSSVNTLLSSLMYATSDEFISEIRKELDQNIVVTL